MAETATSDTAAAADSQPIVLTYQLDAALVYATMVATGKAMMARREPTDKNRSGWWAVGVWLAIMAGFAAFVDLVDATDLKVEILFTVLGVVLGFVFYTIFLNRSYRRVARMMSANPVYAGTLTTTLDADGVETRSGGGVSRLAWTAVEGVLELDTSISLLVPTQIIALPDNGLPDGMTREEALRRIDRWRTAAGAGEGSAG